MINNRNNNTTNTVRRVTLLTAPTIKSNTQTPMVTGLDAIGSQYQIDLTVLPAGVTLDMIQAGQQWFVERRSTRNRLFMYCGEISVSTIQGVTVSGIPLTGQALVATSASGAHWTTISGGGGTVTGSGITALTGDVIASGTGVATALLSGTPHVQSIISSNPSMAVISGQVTINTSSISSLNTSVLTLNSEVSTLSGSISTVSGSLVTTNSNLATLSGNVSVISGEVAVLSGNISSISGSLVTTNSNLALLSGSVSAISGSLTTAISNIATQSGYLSTVSGVAGNAYNNTVTQSGWISSISGSLVTTTSNLATLSGNVSSISGALTTISGVAFAASGMAYTISGQLNTVSGFLANYLPLAGGTLTGSPIISSGVPVVFYGPSINIGSGNVVGLGTLDNFTVGVGTDLTVRGYSSVALGYNITSSGSYATGINGTAYGTYSTAVGNGLSTGIANTALGYSSIANGGTGLHVAGFANNALGAYTLAVGSGCFAIGTDGSGTGAVASGRNIGTIGTVQHAVSIPGSLTVSGNFIVGSSTTLSGNNTAIGLQVKTQSAGSQLNTLSLVDSTTNSGVYLRAASDGHLQIINSSFGSGVLEVTNSGVVTIAQSTGVVSGVPSTNFINLNNNGYLFDDGNLHLHSSNYTLWINALDGSAVQINTQVSGGGGGLVVGGNISSSNISDSGWISVSSFSNSFTTGSVGVAYRRINGIVYLRGNVIGGSAGTTAFTLPSGYTPATTMVFAAQQYGASGDNYVTITSAGAVQPAAGATWFSGIVFPNN
jgi:hypothetical protein